MTKEFKVVREAGMMFADCLECNRTIQYNSHYHCFDCYCGATYNINGSKLNPISDWRDEYDEDDY